MLALRIASWRHHRRRYTATFLAIFLGVAFCAATLSLTRAAERGAGDAAAIQFSQADLVAFPVNARAAELAGRVARLPDVAAAAAIRTGYVGVSWPHGQAGGSLGISEVPAAAGLRWQRLAAGSFPVASDQVVLAADLAASENVSVGSRLVLGGGHVPRRDVTVVGLLAPEKGADGVSPLATRAGVLQNWQVPGLSVQIDVDATPGVSAGTLVREIRHLAPATEVATTDDLRKQAVSGLTDEVDVLGSFLLGFAVIALFVAGLVSSNTFRIVMTQRTRDLALLRCVGAQRSQVFLMSVAEAMLLGGLAAAAGTASGILSSALLVTLANSTSIPVVLSAVTPGTASLALPFAGGVVVTLAACLAPAWRASRITPVGGLMPEAPSKLGGRMGRAQLGAGILLALTGCAALGVGLASGAMLPALAGGVLTFLGVLAVCPLVVPATISLVGRARRLLPRRWQGGVPADLALLNAVRNPRRTAVTTAALVVGVTLIAMLSVGAASVSATESSALDRVTPVDLAVSGKALPARAADQVRGVDGVQDVVTVAGFPVRAGRRSVAVGTLSQDAAARVVRDEALRAQLGQPANVVVPVSARAEVPGGGLLPFRLQTQRGTVRVRPVLSSLATGPMLVAPAVLERLGGHPRPLALYVRLSDESDPQAVVARVQAELRAGTSTTPLSVEGGYAKRSTYDRAISVILIVATALLAMSVVIALVGVANTLSLSVLERRHEHGLLRALGLTPVQLRLVLAGEALLIAGTAAVIGTVLGIGYGWVGTLTLLHGALHQQPTLAVPTARLAQIVGGAVAAGLLSSVLPARRAVRESPVAALSAE